MIDAARLARAALTGANSALARAARTLDGSRTLLAATFDGGYRPDAPAGPAPSVTVSHVSAGYDGGIAIEDVTGHFGPGSLTAIVGPNGAGKTTLLRVLAGVMRPRSGTIETAGAATIAYLPQVATIDRDYPVSVLEFVALGSWRRFGSFRTPPYALLDEVLAALRALGLQDAAATHIRELSVGQFRRVLFARLIVQNAPLIVLDEPFAAIDARTTADLLALLRGWHEEGRTVIAVLHDLDQVREFFPDTLLLARRAVAWGETAEALSAENLARAGFAASPKEDEPRVGLLRVVPS